MWEINADIINWIWYEFKTVHRSNIHVQVLLEPRAYTSNETTT